MLKWNGHYRYFCSFAQNAVNTTNFRLTYLQEKLKMYSKVKNKWDKNLLFI